MVLVVVLYILTVIIPGEPGLAGTRMLPFWILLKLRTVMWSETVGLRTRSVSEQKKIGLGLARLVLCCETLSCHARRHNDIEGHSNFSSTIYSFSILCLEHHYCGDQQWRLLT